MTIQLKTLKDMGSRYSKLVHKKTLKIEAIKWLMSKDTEDINGWTAFKDFFNITEEDLK